MVSIAHASAPHDLTFISLRRKGFNQDFIKRYLCNALRPPATGLFSSFIFSRGLCSKRKGESAFRVLFSGKCSIPRDWTWESVCAEASRKHLLSFILTRWKIITENSQTKMSWTKFLTDHGQSLNTFAKHCFATIPVAVASLFWGITFLKLQIVACLFWEPPLFKLQMQIANCYLRLPILRSTPIHPLPVGRQSICTAGCQG